MSGGIVSRRERTKELEERRGEEFSKGSSRVGGAGGRGSLKKRRLMDCDDRHRTWRPGDKSDRGLQDVRDALDTREKAE